VKEIEKPAVINPKGKLLIDPNIKWDRCELIIMYKGAAAATATKNGDSAKELPPQRNRSKSEAPVRVLPDTKNKKKAVSFKQKEVKELLSKIKNKCRECTIVCTLYVCIYTQYTMPD
jgi:hypothetical protein